MQLGFVTAILPELNFEQVVKIASDIGYDCIEVMCWPREKAERRYAGVTHIDTTDLDEQKAKNILAICENHNVQISGLGYYPNPLSHNPAEADTAIEQIRSVIQGAKILGLDCVNTFIGRDHTLSIEDNWPLFVEVWRPLIRLAEKCNIRIGIENCPMSFGADEWPGGKNLMTSPAIWRRVFEEIPSDHFGLNFDPSHFIWQLMDVNHAITEFRDKLYHLHAKDATLDRERLHEVGVLAHPKLYHTPKLPGLGHVDWPSMIDTLEQIGYNGALCVEVEDRDYESSLDDRITALRKSYAYLRPLLPVN